MIKVCTLILIGGGLGSVLRFLISLTFSKITSIQFPLATLCANVLSVIIVGVTMAWMSASISNNAKLFIITGFCGGLSTFSTFNTENYLLLKQGHYIYFLANIILSIGGGLFAMHLFMRNLAT